MNFKVVVSEHFSKHAKRLSKKYPSLKSDLTLLIATLEINPITGTLLGKNLYKIRLAIASKRQGKSGGARVITYVYVSQSKVYLTDIYDKSEQSSISVEQLISILKQEGVI